jgi:hypothetical protein
MTKCHTCTIVEKIYGSLEWIAPWLCQCRAPPRQSSLPGRLGRAPAPEGADSPSGGGTPAGAEAYTRIRIMGSTIRCHFGCCNPQDGFDDCLFKVV